MGNMSKISRFLQENWMWVLLVISTTGFICSFWFEYQTSTTARWLLAVVVTGAITAIAKKGVGTLTKATKIAYRKCGPTLCLAIGSILCFFLGSLIFLAELSKQTQVTQRPVEFLLIGAGLLLFLGFVLKLLAKLLVKF